VRLVVVAAAFLAAFHRAPNAAEPLAEGHSGLVFTQVDAGGAPADGFVRGASFAVYGDRR
jgi:hypothetical protein